MKKEKNAPFKVFRMVGESEKQVCIYHKKHNSIRENTASQLASTCNQQQSYLQSIACCFSQSFDELDVDHRFASPPSLGVQPPNLYVYI